MLSWSALGQYVSLIALVLHVGSPGIVSQQIKDAEEVSVAGNDAVNILVCMFS